MILMRLCSIFVHILLLTIRCVHAKDYGGCWRRGNALRLPGKGVPAHKPAFCLSNSHTRTLCVLFTHELVIFTQIFFMTSKRLIVFLFLLVTLRTYADDTLTLFSPTHNIRLTVNRQSDGQLKYGVYYKQKFFIK